ncbi:UbiA family prenyltransferase [Burkholderia multivorans]|uniref:UbiA family prenyltransferase n=1 Tax=Burkholderia multivorans TaxID=87883 RepID=A0A8E2UU38_9BURK|nr:UbiA family prenyltransferase [Burkholderia multivorans]MBN6728079.1 UbiA family prenyltransferase [Burkholderia multivorans]MBU9492018.1 UbiA family prenyltransferase [Burkholderia multivorans]MBY4673070.1 UbiA family prenyltransferase [Burkholderia multivorans]MCA8260300.1 UbiA family prenyltransferase [Burkholderia multivorans]MDN7883106.1 UbiA family prenyltransferase [Burkholderia multivorans]
MTSRPLVVDLDGTLLRSDVLIESGFSYLKSFPLRFISPLCWLARGGKPALKAKLAAHTDLDVSVLPYEPQIVEWLREERANGRTIVLATASHAKYAHAIAEYLQLFDEVLATDDRINLSSRQKRDRLVARFGEYGFDYVGNSRDDIPVWQAAHRAYVVNATPSVKRTAQRAGNVERIVESRTPALKTWAKSLRMHQWLKNLLIFLPLLAGHMLGSPHLVVNAVLAFVTFGLCASSVYLLNDLLDLEDDRHHPTKCRRPFASGALPLAWGLAAFPILLASAFALALLALPWRFSVVLLGYYALTLAYSAILKRLVMVDVVVLAMLYTVRIVAGTTAIGAHLTFWLLAFSMFIFLSLALVKRYAELMSMKKRGVTQSRGRGYIASDLELVSSLGSASGYLSVLVLAMYIQDPKTANLYSHPQLIWFACPLLLYWISRTWIIAHRGHMHDDPIIFAVRDRVSLVVIGLCGLVFWAAI